MRVQLPQTPTPLTSRLSNSKLSTIFIGVLIGAAVFAVVWYFQIPPFYGWIGSVGSWGANLINGFTNGQGITETITAYITNNPMIFITGALALGGGLLGLYERSQRIQQENLKLAAQASEIEARNQSSGLYGALQEQTSIATQAQTELAAYRESNIGQLYEAAKTTMTQQEGQIAALEKDLAAARETILNTPVRVVTQPTYK